MPNEQLEAHLREQIEKLKKNKGETIHMDDVALVVRELLESVYYARADEGQKFIEELSGLIDFINRAKSDIAAIRPEDINDDFIPTATDELDAIIQSTENATNAIMDAADEIGDFGATLDPGSFQVVMDSTTKIYEACSFQDLTGQRITKVVSTMQEIEKRIGALMNAFDPEGIARAENKVAKAREASANQELTDEDLLNGPQLPENAANQADIDALFDKT